MSNVPSIPSIPGNIDPQLYQVLTAVKQVLDSSQGNTLVTQNDMTSAISSAIDGVSGQAGIPGQTGANGETGSVGPTGDAYVLDITGGRTTILFDKNGSNPLPPLTPFSYLLYKNGVSVTTGLTFSWYINSPGASLLSGTGSTSTFTPTLASTFDATKADNVVMLTVTYGSLSFTARESIAITTIGATGSDVASFKIDNAGSAFSKNAGGTISPSLGIALTTYTQNITSPTYQWKLNGVNILSATTSSHTVPISDYSSVTTNTYQCVVTGTINSVTGSTLSDTITIPLLVDGNSAPTVVLSNENTTFPALVTGYSSITFTGGNCDVTSYIGSTKLTPTAITALTATAYISALNMVLTTGNQDANYDAPTATLTCTKPIRSITAVDIATDIMTSAGHGYVLFDLALYYYTGTALTGLTQNVNCYVIPITVDTFYLATRTGVAAGAFVLSSKYTIGVIGTTTQAQWNTIAGTTALTYAYGSVFTCANIGTAMGTGSAFPIPNITGGVVAGSTYKVTDNAWNSGGYSTTSFTGGAKLTFKDVSGVANSAMIGLNTDPSVNSSYSSLDYAFLLTAGIIRIYESGTNPYIGGAYVATDVFTILYNNDTVSYYQNNTCLRTVEAASGLTFYFDSSFIYGNTVFSNSITQIGFSAYVAVGANTFTYDTVSVGATVADGVINSVSKLVSIAAPTAMTTDTAYTDVTISPRDAADNALPNITKRINYSLGRQGSNYVAFITGGITNTVYDTGGINPLPAQTAFSCELYENGALVTPATYAWSVPSTNTLLTGSSSTATFTPTLAATFDRTKSNNRVLLTVTYAGITVKAVQPIVMTQLVIAAVDMTAPVAISNLTVSGGVLYNFLGWGTLPGNFDHVEVWRSATNDRTVAALIGTSLFTVYADYIPDGVATVYYYWIRAISKAGVAGAWNAVASAGVSAAPIGIGDSQVSSISATKIFALTLSALTANLGNVTAGTLKSPDAMFIVDLVNKFIIVGNGTNNPGSVSPWYGSEYVDVRSGSLTTYQWNGSSYTSSKSLRVIETGVGNNGVAVSLTKYYSSQPQIIVSPANLQVYSGANSTQNQTLLLTASAVTGSGSAWSFTPTATLQLAAALSGTTVTSNTVTSATDAAINSAVYATVANATSIICSISVNSIRGTGATPNWYYRQVNARIWYSTSPGGPWTPGTAVDIANGANTAADGGTVSVSGLSPGVWYFVVQYISANVAGNPTWSDGGAAYTYATNTVNLAANSALIDTGYVFSDVPTPLAVAPTMPSFTPTAGYSVYNVAYTISYGYYLFTSASSAGAFVQNASGGYLHILSNTGNYSVGTSGVPASTNSTSLTTATYNPAATLLQASAVGTPFLSTYAKTQVKIFASGTSAVISSRIANTNTTAISNSFTLNNYYSNISGTAPLASGTLNWMAIL